MNSCLITPFGSWSRSCQRQTKGLSQIINTSLLSLRQQEFSPYRPFCQHSFLGVRSGWSSYNPRCSNAAPISVFYFRSTGNMPLCPIFPEHPEPSTLTIFLTAHLPSTKVTDFLALIVQTASQLNHILTLDFKEKLHSLTFQVFCLKLYSLKLLDISICNYLPKP